MKKQYRKAIEELFSKEIPGIDPQFKKIQVKAACRCDGEIAFAKEDGIAYWIISIIPNPNGSEEFTLEIGWSRKMRFPDLSLRPSLSASESDAEAFRKDESLLRLNGLMKSGSFGWKFRGVESQFAKKYFSNPESMKMIPGETLDSGFKRIPSESEAAESVRSAVKASLAALENIGLPYLGKCRAFWEASGVKGSI